MPASKNNLAAGWWRWLGVTIDTKSILLEPYEIVVEKATLKWLIIASNLYYKSDGSGINYDKAKKLLKEHLEKEDADER